MRASGFSGSARIATIGKPLLAQEMPTNVSANRPMAISVKRIVLMTDGPRNSCTAIPCVSLRLG